MDAEKTVEQIIEYLGGKQNIAAVTNCMTRLRVQTHSDEPVNEDALKDIPDVLGLVHDRDCSYEVVVGPGKSRKFADICYDMGFDASAQEDNVGDGVGKAEEAGAGKVGGDWKENKDNLKSQQKKSKIRDGLKIIGEIFVPMIPGVIAAGLCAGFTSLLTQLIPNYAEIPAWNLIITFLSLINTAFSTYITAWTGYRAAERFGATPILGGMLGMITSLEGINTIAQVLGLYNIEQPLQSILRTGRGGVLAVIAGVFILAIVEKKIRSRMPDSLDIVFTPLLSLIIVGIPYILIIMPLFGYVSSAIVWVFGKACMSESVIVRLLTGYLSAALFLPMVATGMHHGMVALYSVQLQELGFITLYPALAMAGAGQVGAALAILKKAKQKGNNRLAATIKGTLPAGILGVGEPLIYGVTLPLGKPFITAGLGAGFGGAFVMLMQVASTTWGPSGLLGIFVMTQGPHGPIASIVCYLIGLVISYVMSYIITNIFFSADAVAVEAKPEEKKTGIATAEENKTRTAATEEKGEKKQEEAKPKKEIGENTETGMNKLIQGKKVKHGDPIMILGEGSGATEKATTATGASETCEFTYVIKDPVGIHSRPAGELVSIIKKYKSNFTIEANGHTAEGASVLDIMALGAENGTRLHCKAEGADAAALIKEVKAFMEQKL